MTSSNKFLFNDLWNEVARCLPNGWDITVSVYGGGGSDVVLTDDEGTEHNFPTNWEGLEQTVLDAILFAIQYHDRPRS